MKRLSAIALACWIAAACQALAFPAAQCALSADKSSLIVTASNDSDTAYRCTVECRLNLAGQRAIERFSCNYNLGANSAEAAVCAREGGSSGFFTAVSPTKMACAPSN